eukprot:9108475-Ditylum_brightwellii.AAC.1
MDTLGSLASSMVSQEKLNKETSRFIALNNGMHMDMTMLRAKFEQLEKTHKVQTSLITPVTPNAEEKQALKARSTSPSAESHKRRHKSLDIVCNTPNVIMGSQQPPNISKKELRPCHRWTPD